MRGSTNGGPCIAAREAKAAAYNRLRIPMSSVGSNDQDGAAGRPARILLVDDEQPVQKLLSFPLEKEGYEVVPALDGQEALQRFDSERFDLVVLDIMLPKVDGLEVCRRLRAK